MAAACALGAVVGTEEAFLQTAAAAKHKKVVKHHKAKHIVTPSAVPAPTLTPAATALACSLTPGEASALDAALGNFVQHINSAHLQTDPVEQAKALLTDTNNYILLHTVLVNNMLKPTVGATSKLGDVVNGLIVPLMAHLDSAHLETSPQDQVNALLTDTNNYVLVHTVLANNMVKPLEALLMQIAAGTAAKMTCAPGASAPATPSAMTADHMTDHMAAAVPMTASIANFKFAPAALTVATGTAVTWKNSDSVAHTVTSDGSGPLSSPNVPGGGTYNYTFTAPGTFKYVCSIHPNMMGTVVVQ